MSIIELYSMEKKYESLKFYQLLKYYHYDYGEFDGYADEYVIIISIVYHVGFARLLSNTHV